MEPSASASALRQFFMRRGLDFEAAPLSDMLETALAFYTMVPAAGLTADGDPDMLLFQFGTYDWGAGEFFEFDITRQFIEADGEGDDAFSQLRCTFLYEPTAELKGLGAANRWCHARGEVPEFRLFIVSTQAYQAALPLIPVRRAIEWSYV
jgi:hypothetical protein